MFSIKSMRILSIDRRSSCRTAKIRSLCSLTSPHVLRRIKSLAVIMNSPPMRVLRSYLMPKITIWMEMPLRKLGVEMIIRNMPKDRKKETKRPSNAKKNSMS